MLKRVKVITGYTKDAQWHYEAEPTKRTIPRQADIPSPYSYSPDHVVYEWRGMDVIHVETRHRRYEVFQIQETI